MYKVHGFYTFKERVVTDDFRQSSDSVARLQRNSMR
jgi:hypothetical protein